MRQTFVLSWMTFPPKILIIESLTLTLTEGSEGCNPLDVVLFLLRVIATLLAWDDYGRSSPPVKVHHYSMFPQFGDNDF